LNRSSRFELIAGHPVLDLVNTVSWRGDPARRTERLPDFDALLAWSARAGLIKEAEREGLARTPGRGARALADTRRLRERLHRALTATEPGRPEAIELMWPQLTAALRHAGSPEPNQDSPRPDSKTITTKRSRPTTAKHPECSLSKDISHVRQSGAIPPRDAGRSFMEAVDGR
jgi:predicted RNA-binding Zn ribbon-like protein